MTWSFTASWPVVLAAISIWGISAWLSHLHWVRSGRKARIGRLELLRTVLVGLIGLTLLQPEFVRTIQRKERPKVLVLSDRSGSMATRDIVAAGKVIPRGQWLQDQLAAEFWRPLARNSQVATQTFAAASTTNASVGTDISGALENALQREQNLKAVLLLTDGDWNSGPSPEGVSTRYRDQQVPVFSVTVGAEKSLPDLELVSVSPPAYGLFGEQITIPFVIQSHLTNEVRTNITLFQGTKIEATRQVVIPANGEVRDSILWSPGAGGEASLNLKLPVVAGEMLAENNEKAFKTEVRVETLKVLVVDSLPRWEYRFLRNALARDPGVEMNCLLFHPGMPVGGGKNYLQAFPAAKDQISKYDVIFLGDVGLGDGELKPADLEAVKGLIEQQGSGLVLLPGRRGRLNTLEGSALKELFPVALDPAKPTGILLQNEAPLVLSPLGRRHLLTRFDGDEFRNDEIWKQLPGFFWSAGVDRSRPGSEVLGLHPTLRNATGRMPLLVTRNAGNGKVLFLGTDSAWRWRRGVEDKYHYRFWSQVVRWMSHQRHLAEKDGVRLVHTPEAPQVGETIYLQSTVLNKSGFPIEEGKQLSASPLLPAALNC